MLATLAAIQFTATLDFMVMMPLAPQFTRLFGLSAREFGFLISAYTFAAAAAGIVTSLFVDRFDRKRLLLAVYLGFVGSAVVTAAAQSYPTLLGARALAGVFGGVLGGLIFAIIGDTVPESRRGRATGIVMTSFSVATVAGVPVALLLTNLFGWRAAFGLVAVLGIAAAAGAHRVLPTTHERERPDSRGVWKEFVRTLTFPNHLRAFLFTLLMMISGFTVIPYVSLYITSNAGLPERDLPWIYLVGGVATFFTARWIGRWADRAGKREVYRRIAWISLLPLLAITHAPVLPAVRRADTDHALLRLRVRSPGAGDGHRHECRASGRARCLHDAQQRDHADGFRHRGDAERARSCSAAPMARCCTTTGSAISRPPLR